MFYKESNNFLSKESKKFIETVVLGYDFPFYRLPSATSLNDEIYAHTVLKRTEERGGEKVFNSPYTEQTLKIIQDFLDKEKLYFKSIERVAYNLTYNNGHLRCGVHKDHEFPYYQLIIYLNDCIDKKSKTVILKEDKKTILKQITPKKYRGICFDNKPHYLYYPKKGSRLVLVATFKL